VAWYICQTLEMQWEYNGTIHQLFMGFKKVYDPGEKYCIIYLLDLVYP
jgi:predicted alpha/beta superfamily hydrolase